MNRKSWEKIFKEPGADYRSKPFWSWNGKMEEKELFRQLDILKEMGLPFYDPLLIIEKTDGRMAGDEQWILILKNKEARHGTDPS